MICLKTYSRLQVDQYGSRNVSRIVGLVEENVFAVSALRCEVLQITILTNAMLLAKLLPKLATNYMDIIRAFSRKLRFGSN